MSQCQTCGAEIEWARTEEGHSIPLDKVPVADGNIDLVLDKGRWTARVLKKAQLEKLRAGALPGLMPKLYRSHFATCPQSDYWRRNKKRTNSGEKPKK